MQVGSALQAAPVNIHHKISRKALENHNVPQPLLDPENLILHILECEVYYRLMEDRIAKSSMQESISHRSSTYQTTTAILQHQHVVK